MFSLRAIQFALLLTFCLGSSSFTASRLGAANAPVSAAQIALYQGADRKSFLIEGAKKEGRVSGFLQLPHLVQGGRPRVRKKISIHQSRRMARRRRRCDEARHRGEPRRPFLTDVVESTAGNIGGLHKNNLLQEHASPELRFFDDDVVAKGNRGVFYWADRETYISLGFNTTHVAVADAPKRLNDLLDPRLKGKMSLAGGATSARWVGAVVESAGREFIEKLGRHDINVHKLSGAALANLVVTGEVPISPTIFDSNIFVAKRKGAPVEWLPVEPVIANVGYSGIVSKAPHPHAALLLIDYLHSKEGQQFIVKGGLSSPRDDVESLVNQKFKKVYFEAKYSVDEYEKKLSEWEELIQKHFISKR